MRRAVMLNSKRNRAWVSRFPNAGVERHLQILWNEETMRFLSPKNKDDSDESVSWPRRVKQSSAHLALGLQVQSSMFRGVNNLGETHTYVVVEWLERYRYPQTCNERKSTLTTKSNVDYACSFVHVCPHFLCFSAWTSPISESWPISSSVLI